MRMLGALSGEKHTIRRAHAMEDVIKLYRQGQIVRECPLRIAFSGEIAIDHGGVSREMFSLFWEEAIRRHFEGSKSVTPLVHAHTDMALLPVLGTILSHGFLVTSFLPVHICLPSLLVMLLGSNSVIPDEIL